MIKRPQSWTIFSEFDDIFNGFTGIRREQVIRSTVNNDYTVETDDKEMRLFADVPGVKLVDLSITIDDNSRTVSIAGMCRGREIIHKYIIDGEFDLLGAKAQLIDGVLTMTFARGGKAQPRKIPIEGK